MRGDDQQQDGMFSISHPTTDPNGRIFGGQAAIQLSSSEAAAGLLLGGCSGAPVLVGRPERAAGLIRWNPVRDNDPQAPVEGIVFACPASSMVKCSDALAPYVDVHANVTDLITVRNSRQGDLLPEETKQDLDRLRRQQRFQRPESQWLPLPTFSFNVPFATVKNKIREFVEGMLRIFALGVSEIMPPNLQRIEFVSLCSVNRLPTDYNLMLQTRFRS